MGFRAAVPFIKDEYNAYLDALRSAGIEPVPVDSASSDPDCDGLLLPGGADINPSRYSEENTRSLGIDDVLDALQFAMLKKHVEACRPVLGICRGHQLINVFFGGSLYQHLPAADAHCRKDGLEQFHPAFMKEGSVLYSLYGPEITVNSTHHQGVNILGEGLSVIAEADDGTVEAIVHDTLPVIGVQWHPERMLSASGGKADGKMVFEMFRGMMEQMVLLRK